MRLTRPAHVLPNVAVLLRADEDVEALAARVLLHVPLESLKRRVHHFPVLRRDKRLAERRVGNERQRRGHQNLCPQMRWVMTITNANAVRNAVRTRKKTVAGPAASEAQPPKRSTG